MPSIQLSDQELNARIVKIEDRSWKPKVGRDNAIELLRGQVESSDHPARAILLARLQQVAKSDASQISQSDAIPDAPADDPLPASPARLAERECYRLLDTGGSLQQLAAAVNRFVALCDLGTGYTYPDDPFADDACDSLLTEIRWRGYIDPDVPSQAYRSHIKQTIVANLDRQAPIEMCANILKTDQTSLQLVVG